ncbi:hypothetical protein EYC84_010180 [Monilinia fructicola]|uniref:Uncharacterized protein n=1 Tax=Monilinia fructicola TaxID=38448 RepID=A0A5M9JFL6_MONFR|nr:hypothetical protein EYC84_010180 [Monilinia fructicola]
MEASSTGKTAPLVTPEFEKKVFDTCKKTIAETKLSLSYHENEIRKYEHELQRHKQQAAKLRSQVAQFEECINTLWVPFMEYVEEKTGEQQERSRGGITTRSSMTDDADQLNIQLSSRNFGSIAEIWLQQ